MASRECQWQEYRRALTKNWECSFPKFDSIEEEPNFKFSTLEEAYEVFQQALPSLLDHSSLYDCYAKLNMQAHTKWIRSVIAQAPETCDLIVIRSTYTPEKNAIRSFNLHVASHKPAFIEAYGYCPVWIAFRPDEKIHSQNWCMVKTNSTVEYLVKD